MKILLRIAHCVAISLLCIPAVRAASNAPQTERQYLSGHGPADAISWEFSVTGGRRAGEKTTIPVPSNWEQLGFGSYNYGLERENRADEHGLYRTRFNVPDSWKDRRVRIVFDGVMTDTTVHVNGHLAGPIHQGGFYRFSYDITSLVKFGDGAENVLEVDVAKASSDHETEIAERGGDYWIFGGIYRPVWIESVPAQAIDHVAIDARADGTFAADVTLGAVRDADRVDGQIFDHSGKPVGAAFSVRVPAGGAGRVRISTHVNAPKLWTAETPNLYTATFTLRRGESDLHVTTTRFGFRTFEVRAGEGLFLNGQRILLKGANRHSFRPETGRALTREECYEDARLMRAMNMNAARMSHYPPDEAFLEACDEIGLYVLDELSGWQHSHGTAIGRLLVREMVERDVNHPSILFWDNANEGGWNRALDGEYDFYDPQHRRVLHPWELHDDVDTKHYPIFSDLVKRLEGPHLLMPTEFLHALYDGGGGAGLEDYWNAISRSRFGAGGFIWALLDEGVARTDLGGRIDVFGNWAPDGLVGPHLEKEASYYTVRDIWSPVQIDTPVLDERFDGKLRVTNRYDFTSLESCRFAWRLVNFPTPESENVTPSVVASGETRGPAIAAHHDGVLSIALPAQWQGADALELQVFGPDQQPLWQWTWPSPRLRQRITAMAMARSTAAPQVEANSSEVRLSVGDISATFDATTGLLQNLRRGAQSYALTNGPTLAYARPEGMGETEWLFANEDPSTETRRLAAPHLANVIEVDAAAGKSAWVGFRLEISSDGATWKTLSETTKNGDRTFKFPPQRVLAVRLSNFHSTDQSPVTVKTVRVGYNAARFPAPAASGSITHGSGTDPKTGKSVAWVENHGGGGLDHFRWTLHSNGALQLEYRYTLRGDFLYHGITFDHPESEMKSLRWLGEGPYRVWQNRLRGTGLGVHEIANHVQQSGETWNYPEFQGCFAGLRWARLTTNAGALTVTSVSPEIYLRVGTPRISHPNTTPELPAGDVSFLHAIPAIGTKFTPPEKCGPASQPAKAEGAYEGTLTFEVAP
jgi:hypothetical protein